MIFRVIKFLLFVAFAIVEFVFGLITTIAKSLKQYFEK